MLPLAFKLEGRRVLVLGAGKVGARRARQLVDAGAEVTVITTEVIGDVTDVGRIELRPYAPGDLSGFHLVVSAVGDPDVNDAIVLEAERQNIWLNVVDDPERSSFYFTAEYRDGDVVVSVSTEGSSPALAQVLRDRLREALPSNAGATARRLRDERALMHQRGESTESRDWRGLVNALLDEDQP